MINLSEKQREYIADRNNLLKELGFTVQSHHEIIGTSIIVTSSCDELIGCTEITVDVFASASSIVAEFIRQAYIKGGNDMDALWASKF